MPFIALSSLLAQTILHLKHFVIATGLRKAAKIELAPLTYMEDNFPFIYWHPPGVCLHFINGSMTAQKLMFALHKSQWYFLDQEPKSKWHHFRLPFDFPSGNFRLNIFQEHVNFKLTL